ncbi:MAG: lamin tail domain-containing protein [Xenococcaceae cyanobacterium MO_188.B19]|nr:lamin tail domain-containing protein [Xenococcaceae cyanobacterium MO_188.B19]
MDIYQEIWDADQAERGIPAILPNGIKDETKGYVVVDENGSNPDHVLFSKVKIPEHKLETYRLCETLLNNYALSQTQPETNTAEEISEVQEFLNLILHSSPMKVARDYVQQQIGQSITDARWYQILHDIWFRQYDQGNNQDLSGFEHVIVGEQKGSKIGGYHFWYKYYLDDIIGFLGSDDISYIGTRYDGQNPNAGSLTTQGVLVPEVVTLAYKWDAYDYQTRERRPLYKPIGGFWVGCSIEGLMALGTVRCLIEARAPKETIINNAKYSLKVFRSPDGRSMRTFYPKFLGLITSDEDNHPISEAHIRLVAALINPEGHDTGKETVTLLNLSPQSIDLTGWFLKDKFGNTLELGGQSVGAGATLVVKLPPNQVILSNKGGKVGLYQQQQLVHEVSYTKAEVGAQGWTTVF